MTSPTASRRIVSYTQLRKWEISVNTRTPLPDVEKREPVIKSANLRRHKISWYNDSTNYFEDNNNNNNIDSNNKNNDRAKNEDKST